MVAAVKEVEGLVIMTGRINREKKEAWEQLLQRQAHALKKITGRKLCECYDEIAKQKGYKTYAALRAVMKAKV